MAEDERLSTTEAPRLNSTPNGPEKLANSSNLTQFRNLKTAKEFISSKALRIVDQPLRLPSEVWGVLIATSEKARQRCQHFLPLGLPIVVFYDIDRCKYWEQGFIMPLTCDEHFISRLVDDTYFRITAPAVSANHCKIYRKRKAGKLMDY